MLRNTNGKKADVRPSAASSAAPSGRVLWNSREARRLLHLLARRPRVQGCVLQAYGCWSAANQSTIISKMSPQNRLRVNSFDDFCEDGVDNVCSMQAARHLIQPQLEVHNDLACFIMSWYWGFDSLVRPTPYVIAAEMHEAVNPHACNTISERRQVLGKNKAAASNGSCCPDPSKTRLMAQRKMVKAEGNRPSRPRLFACKIRDDLPQTEHGELEHGELKPERMASRAARSSCVRTVKCSIRMLRR